MERARLEEIRKLSNEELLRIVSRRSFWRVDAAREILERLKRGEIPNPKDYLRAILGIRVKAISQEKEVEELKEEVAERLAEGTLEERDILIILDEVESQEVRDEMAEKFLSENEKVGNYILVQIIRRCTQGPQDKAAKKLLKQSKIDDLMVLIEECEGPIQMEAFEKLKKRGVSTKDGVYIAGYNPNPALADLGWQEIKERKLHPDDLLEICDSDSEKVAKEAATKLWQRIAELDKQHLLYLFKNPKIVEREDPERVREEAGKKLLEFNLDLEEMLEISKANALKIKAKQMAIKKAKEEIQRIEKEPICFTRQEILIEELNDLIKRLKSEIEAEILIAK